MKPPDLIRRCAQDDLTLPSEFFRFLSLHLPEAELSDGRRVRDASDFKAWLRELSEAADAWEIGGDGEMVS